MIESPPIRAREPPSLEAGDPGKADLYRQIIEASPNGLLQIGEDGRILLVNRCIEAMFGYDRADLLGRPVEVLLPARFRASHGMLRRNFIASAATRPMGADRVIIGLRRDGTEFPVEIGLNPIMLDGQVSVLGAVQDISARHATLQERERQRQDLERTNGDLAEFAHAASHDLKAPLRGMAHLAEWIAEDVAKYGSAETLQHCNTLRARAERMQRLLDGLLAYAKAGRSARPPETFDTERMLHDLVGTLALPAGFTVEYAVDVPSLTTARLPLERVLQNLIENAVKHHDRPTGHIVVSVSRAGERIRFAVADDGPGIPPRYHQRVFHMFQTLARRDDVETSGIGLAIVKKKVEIYGGKVTVESAPPARGTRFVFTWPTMTVE